MNPEYVVGEKVVLLVDPDNLLKDYLKSIVFDTKIDIQAVKTYALLEKGKKYVISDVCKPCNRVTIKVRKNNHLSIRFDCVSKLN